MQSSAQPFAAWTICPARKSGSAPVLSRGTSTTTWVHLCLHGAGELVSLLGEDRERWDELAERGAAASSSISAGVGVPAREDAEVDADLDARLFVLAHEPRDLGLVD